MDAVTTGLLYLLALTLFWTGAAKLLPGRALAGSEDMTWAHRPGLAGGTIAGVVEVVAAIVFLLTALGLAGGDLLAVVAGVGIGAHMGVAATKAEDAIAAEGQSRVPNFVIAALALLAAVLLLVD